MDLARAPRRAPLTARKKGSGYENGYNARCNLVPSPQGLPQLARHHEEDPGDEVASIEVARCQQNLEMYAVRYFLRLTRAVK
jgi:hypothetical protein